VEHLAEAALRGDAVAGLRVINEAVDSGSDPRQFGQQLVEHLRYVLLAQTASADLIDASDEMRGVYTRQAGIVAKPVLLRAVRAFNDAVNDQRSGWQPQLSLELALLDSVQGREVAPAETGMGSAPAPQLPADLDAHIERIVAARLAAMPAGSAAPQGRGQAAAAPPPADEPEAQADPKAAGVVPLSDIRAKWSEVIRAAKSRNAILSALLDHVEPQGVNGNVVTLAANNDVFLERVNTSEHRSLLNYILSRLHDQTLKVRVVRVGETTNQEAGTSSTYDADDPVMKAARELGAEIKPADDE
jgi:DNA polymerase-3 subunit gamma/tau